MNTMKKAIIILCLLVLLPLAVSAQSKTVFKDVVGYLCLTDEQGNRKLETLKKYDNCEFSYYYASSLTPKYLSLSIKLLGSKENTAILLDNQSSVMQKLDYKGKNIYQIYSVFDNGVTHMYSFSSSTNNIDELDIIWFKYKGNDLYPYGIFSFKTKAAPVMQILEWIYNNKLIIRDPK